MNSKDTSKSLSWLLRHGANEAGLAMDAAGFAAVDDVLRVLRISRAALDDAVADNNKSRFTVTTGPAGDRIRAVQGHSLGGTPVTLDALEASWARVDDVAVLFHGTSVAAARSILNNDQGIHSAARTHVHLAPSHDAKVGKRAGVDVVLVVDAARLRAAGFDVFRADNGVLLCRGVPRACVRDVLAENRHGAAARAELQALVTPA